jgi:hypothetical protein
MSIQKLGEGTLVTQKQRHRSLDNEQPGLPSYRWMSAPVTNRELLPGGKLSSLVRLGLKYLRNQQLEDCKQYHVAEVWYSNSDLWLVPLGLLIMIHAVVWSSILLLIRKPIAIQSVAIALAKHY